jgi:hypothetical protein
MSREFREGLRRNLPSHLDRNLHTSAGVTASSDGAGDLSCSSRELFVTNGSRDLENGDQNRVPAGSDCCKVKGLSEGDVYSGDMRGDNSFLISMLDESGSQSLTPSMDGKCKLQNSIAFWEELQRSGK